MKKQVVFTLALLIAWSAVSQNVQRSYDRIEKLLYQQHYTSAYQTADSLRTWAWDQVKKKGDDEELSRCLLHSTWYMERAALRYQEDVVDSSMARFRAILPHLTPVDRCLCYLFLGKVDSALADTLMLRDVPNTQIASFCTEPKEVRFNTTPTMYDLVMQLAILNVPLQRKIELQRQLTEWYRSRPSKENVNLLLYNELQLLDYLTDQPNKTTAYRRQLTQECMNRYRWTGNEQLALLYDDLAGYSELDSDYVGAVVYCDSAIDRWPKSQGGVDCANRKREIQMVKILTNIASLSPAGRDILVKLNTRNVEELYYRVIAYPEWYKNCYKGHVEIRTRLMNEKVIKSWSQTFTLPKDYKYYSHYGYIPQLSPGRYMLLVSPTKGFTVHGFCVQSFTVSAAAFVLMSSVQDSLSGYVVDYVTGEPIARQQVQVQRRKDYSDEKYTTVATATTDAKGFFSTLVKREKKEYYGYEYRLLTRYKGFDVTAEQSIWSNNRDTIRYVNQIFLDRPVYRPGDTLQFMLVEGRVVNNRDGRAIVGDSVRVDLRDVNYKTIDTLFGVTDAYGSLSGTFVIPANALPGQFNMVAYSTRPNVRSNQVCSKWFPVEAYKQPKFTVTLHGVDRKDAEGHSVAPAMGDSLVVEGLAASYTQVPVSGAKVVYSVTRTQRQPWWRRGYWNMPVSETAVLVSDSLTTDAEGHFRIAFVAEPDSNMELSTKPCFSYEVRVDVTDINGETHSQSHTLDVGYENSYITISLQDQVSELNSMEYRYCDLNGTPLKGDVTLTIERLREPESPWLSHVRIEPGVRHTISKEEFHKRFPLTPYSYEEEKMLNWPVEKWVYDTRLKCEGLNSNKVPLPVLEAGVYRVRIALDGSAGQQVSDEAVVVFTPRTSSRVHCMDLLWSDINTTEARVGDTVVLRFGSRHKNVQVAYELMCGDKRLDRRLLRVDNGISTIRIPVSEAMLGGFDISLCAVKEGRPGEKNYHVAVPFEHKKLDVQIVTFRDKLTPGEKEQWTIKVSPKHEDDGPIPPAALLLGMYDASLDNYGYGGNSFAWFPWQNNETHTAPGLEFDIPWHYRDYDDLLVDGRLYRYEGKAPGGWTFSALNHRGWQWWRSGSKAKGIVASVGGIGYSEGSTARGEDGMVTMSGNTRKRAAAKSYESVELVNEVAVVTDLVVVEDDYAEMEEVAFSSSKVSGTEKPYIRTNLNTLAFFEPTLRTDKDGTVNYSFTAPDLLTQWNVKGLAWTQELATGQLERQLITRKELMIQPNMPRFLREGDTATLMAKVMNLTDSDMTVKVEFSFMIENSQFSILNSQFITVPAHGTVPVLFPVTVPVGGTVATYKYVATATSPLERGTPKAGGMIHLSDGEQGPLPLLTNRQAVTQSVSMYMNGKGTKQYTMSIPASTTAQPVSFSVEYTANPIWLAIQSLPFMSECSNPSNIYLFNSYYVNTLGKTIADQHPELKHCADNATEEDSPLFRNTDIKQTLLDETPWLRSGTSEVERLKNIAHFYDPEALQRQCSEAVDKLQKAQRGDGGWSWMPDGRYSSTYVTQYILKGLGNMQDAPSRIKNRALAYVDKEAYKDYLDWMKYLQKHPNSQCKPIMLDYLYTRSYYKDKKLAADHQKAFDYFYGNAKQRYSDYTSLYDQALLALVFHRHGDTKLAKEMVERIKQKALYSDEMGMYWRDNRAGYFYYQRPVETQALLIETFREVLPADTFSVAQMQQWLLKQKQTTRWSSDIATLRAIQSLMPSSPLERGTPKAGGMSKDDSFGRISSSDQIIVKGKSLADTLTAPTTNAGYLRHTYRNDSLAALSKDRTVSATIVRPNKGISWGALYYQYTEQMDKVPASETGITITRQLYRINADGSLSPLERGTAQPGGMSLHVGDRLRVRLQVSCDRNLEYVEMKAFRAACLEPVTTASGWVWGSLHYYVAVNNSHEAIYIDRLEKGKYTIDADYYVTNPGTFTLAPSVLQCLYAPEFRATSSGQRLTVKE